MTGQCRLGAYKPPPDEEWDFRYMDVDNFTHDISHQINDFHPIMLRSIATFVSETTDIGNTGIGNSNIWPTVILDFGQFNEIINIDAFYSREDGDREKYMQWWSGLRHWIMTTTADSNIIMYLQMYIDSTADRAPVNLTSNKVPIGAPSKSGFTGVITNAIMKGFRADKAGALEYTIKFQVGRIVTL